MIPSNSLSSEPVIGSFMRGDSYPSTTFIDYQEGGIGIQDPSAGLTYQVWTAKLDNNKVYLSAENTSEFIAFSGSGITEISFSFDQNMLFNLAYVENGESKLYWYDSSIQGMTVTNFGSSVSSPKLTLDDKRSSQSQNSDLIFAYVRNESLYYRQQRDRFQVEYFLLSGVSKLKKVGMSDKLRLQFLWE